MIPEQQKELRKVLSDEDKLESFCHWFKSSEYEYLGLDYGKPDTNDKSELHDKCAKDFPFLTECEIKKWIDARIELNP